MGDSQYSFSLTSFSPTGKLVQIEHALTAVGSGQTSLGIKAANGIVIATEKKLPSILVDESSMETETCAGVGADVAKWIKAVDCESTTRGFNPRRSSKRKYSFSCLRPSYNRNDSCVNVLYWSGYGLDFDMEYMSPVAVQKIQNLTPNIGVIYRFFSACFSGPVLAAPVNSYIIWFGHRNKNHQAARDFIYSLSSSPPYPSVADWWRAVRFHTDQMELAKS
ncbi:hypothetical protein NC651_039695 [Populus alba x Populus x berolinensis]|nr:hypothetical protein NC651_039695 [Populus alba x Populus x berolinensis]